MDNRTQPLADGVWRIEVAPLTNAYLVAADGIGDGGGLTLVDSGTRRSGPGLVRSVRLLGLDPRAVTDLVLTHWHRDHTGSAARFASSSAATRVHVGRDDLAAVQGRDARPQRSAAPEDVTRLGRVLGHFVSPGPPVPNALPLDHGMTLEHAAGAEVIASPGHTAGHIALHLARQGVLLAGDAVLTIGRLTRGPGPFRSARSHEAATLRRLAALDFDVLAVGHGPPLVRGGRRRLAALADRVAG